MSCEVVLKSLKIAFTNCNRTIIYYVQKLSKIILSKISASLFIPFAETQIDNFNVLSVVAGKPRVLLVKFINIRTRNAWLKAMKTNVILLSELIRNASSSRIYINERSTGIERKAMIEVKKHARSSQFKYCWMTRVQIYLKKDDNSKRMNYPEDFISEGVAENKNPVPNSQTLSSGTPNQTVTTQPN